MPRTPRVIPEQVGNEDDKKRSLRDWGKLTAEILKLKCNQYGLDVVGNRTVLKNRLFEHFQQQNNSIPVESITSGDNDSPRDDEGGSSNELILAELRALRSELGAVKTKQAQLIKNQQSSSTINPVLQRETERNIIQHDSPLTRQDKSPSNNERDSVVPQYGFQAPPFINMVSTRTVDTEVELNQSNAGRNLIVDNFTTVSGNNAIPTNPFIPPPIKVTLLKKIEKMEYIDFEELLPVLASSTPSNSEGNTIDVDFETSALRLRPKDRNQKIKSLGAWMGAWNNFMQAYLHFKPDMFYMLFAYQKIFCRLAGKYKFDACYLYDKDIRMLIASQASLPPSQRTVAWDTVNQEVMNMYLHENMLPVCYHCHATGHYASVCPSKTVKSSPQGYDQSSNFCPQSSFRPNTESNQQRIPYHYNANTPNQPQRNYSNEVACQRFNKGAFCSKPPCQYMHVCNKCGRNNHSGNRCNAKTNTSFIP